MLPRRLLFAGWCALSLIALVTVPLTSLAEPVGHWREQVLAAADQAGLPRSALSVAAVPLDGPGRAQYFNADAPFSPASTMKLVTTYAALELLGPTFRWHTRLYTDGTREGDTLRGNVYFVSGGDPKLTEERLWSMLRELRAQGIAHIHGDLVLDDSYFYLPATWPLFDDDGDNPYAPYLVEPDAMLSNFNLHHVRASAGPDGIRLWATPALPSLVLDNQLVPADTGRCPAARSLGWSPLRQADGQVTLTVTGTLPSGCEVGRYLSLLSPDLYTGELLRALWQGIGGTWRGGQRRGVLAAGTTLLATSSSPDVVSVVRDINKYSNNPMARQLYLTIGAQHRVAGDVNDFAATERAVREWLVRKGVDVDGLVLDNGSGLSRIERISARQLAGMLEQVWRSPFAAEMIASMPLVAMDGTMRSRLRNTDMAGEGHIKTGSLRDVRAIAGFARDARQTTWAVVMLINYSDGMVPGALLDKMLAALRVSGAAVTVSARESER
ncbi:D-alanyl-D-alanine carboxypeptidase/D-alanyl-D-alanine-endopeptidase [Alcanivorax sp. S71-1-4]|uniref:D-alanyl-D-alanine carboxypeptidase/D-alanyl-D-alanine endopeptidase n=1 Tax=Alcanivorax sp. S71-1-4 TaxID=1177159 RepID=UPI00169711B6|nr:D-alanyl-D-alanine carboxypeptidase/D-alanyl-D-alanine-endopeptidase [Alcanivorax sp. S71-1-4]KAF0808664.1 D-alanyl-D-alanine carboxypeptidase/D-alanyl-D-alanine-endopeptidase [Alcanivorax sp. S71-1-4]